MKLKSMKGLSIEETWKVCLRMWKWISQHWQEDNIHDLKKKWVDKHGYVGIHCNCFFCTYAKSTGSYSERCLFHCPARKVDPGFMCINSSYHFIDHPKQFYQKLVELNEIRLKKKVEGRK